MNLYIILNGLNIKIFIKLLNYEEVKLASGRGSRVEVCASKLQCKFYLTNDCCAQIM